MQELELFKAELSSLTHSELSRRVRGEKALQERIERLYYKYLPSAPRLNKGCGNCYMDACIILLTTKTQALMEERTRLFLLRAGLTLRDMSINQGQIYTHHNLTDEIALRFIRLHEADAEEFVKKFSAVPTDWPALAFPVEEKPERETEAKSEEKPEDEKEVSCGGLVDGNGNFHPAHEENTLHTEIEEKPVKGSSKAKSQSAKGNIRKK